MSSPFSYPMATMSVPVEVAEMFAFWDFECIYVQSLSCLGEKEKGIGLYCLNLGVTPNLN
jgi:hypothetical protein